MPGRTVPAVAFLLLVAACTTSPSESTSTSTTEPAASSTTAAAGAGSTTTTIPITAGPTIEWERIDAPDVFTGGFLNAVVEAGPGLVGVGHDEGPEDAAVWVSEDGRTWERIDSDSFSGEPDDDGVEGSQSMDDAAVGPAGIVAVGSYERQAERDVDPGAWLSEDGLTWERIVDDDFVAVGPGAINAITVWRNRYYAVGFVAGPVGSGESRPAIWGSDDGREWQPAESPVLRVDGSIVDVVARGSRLFAVGSTGHVARPALWYSDDGEAWDLVDSAGDGLIGAIEVGEVGDQTDMFMTSVAATPDGFAATGGRGNPAQAVFWKSEEGLFWDLIDVRSDPDRPTDPLFLFSLLSTREGLLAVGFTPLDTSRFPPISFAQVWLSADNGSSWYQVERTDSSMAVDGPTSPWHIGAMTGVIPFGGGLIATGYVPYQNVSLPNPFYHPAVWIGTWQQQ